VVAEVEILLNNRHMMYEVIEVVVVQYQMVHVEDREAEVIKIGYSSKERIFCLISRWT
jgi:hypothetical protein